MSVWYFVEVMCGMLVVCFGGGSLGGFVRMVDGRVVVIVYERLGLEKYCYRLVLVIGIYFSGKFVCWLVVGGIGMILNKRLLVFEGIDWIWDVSVFEMKLCSLLNLWIW